MPVEYRSRMVKREILVFRTFPDLPDSLGPRYLLLVVVRPGGGEVHDRDVSPASSRAGFGNRRGGGKPWEVRPAAPVAGARAVRRLAGLPRERARKRAGPANSQRVHAAGREPGFRRGPLVRRSELHGRQHPTRSHRGERGRWPDRDRLCGVAGDGRCRLPPRSEEHTSELQSHHDLVCRLLLEKKKKKQKHNKNKKNKKKKQTTQ